MSRNFIAVAHEDKGSEELEGEGWKKVDRLLVEGKWTGCKLKEVGQVVISGKWTGSWLKEGGHVLGLMFMRRPINSLPTTCPVSLNFKPTTNLQFV